ncbi:E3 ubiquitin-protein ligase TRIM11-like [Rana temporaria]|uniref:E3 ubiquitin-protein ligase TRIM11-like n=1 Tax=Rana temporaria TaxID=8407 RepID=UPI001AAD77DA|nr:E3 ubiquitin-protein ligase TRIM11-like [Rana temporaria]
MASADLMKELECSVCLSIYTDPVMLKCGHNFCRECIDRVLDTQRGSGTYSCPECRGEFQERPALQRNITLRNISENFQSTQPDQKESGVFCTYCIHTPVSAVRSCQLCEASLCDNHLKVHSKSPEHVITDPAASPENRKCSLHKKSLEYYCKEDSTCVCVYCLIGEHKGHQMESLDEASETKKNFLANVLHKLATKRNEAEKRVQSLQEHQRKVQGKAAGDTERITVMFRDLKRRLEDLERRILSDISGQVERVSVSVLDLIEKLEMKKVELSRKMGIIEELCKTKDPVTILQRSDKADLCEDGDNKDLKRHDTQLRDGGLLDVAWITHMSKTLLDTIKGINVCFYVQEAADVLLDVNTAHNNLFISVDKKSASRLNIGQKRPETPARFQFSFHVMSSQRFTSGQHYWEVDVGGSVSWRVGMCYPSMERKGSDHSWIGRNNKSWGLFRNKNEYSVVHNRKVINLPDNASSDRVRIFLDYEGGQISFYSVCGTTRHLHTFSAAFTEPLYAVLGVWEGFVRVCKGNSR